MSKVFIGGSRHVTSLNAEIIRQLDNIVNKEFSILIGDANGADKAVQNYLNEKHYIQVEVFFTNDTCRNNIGHWTSRSIPFASKQHNAQFYSAKDKTMAEQATLGFMIWDGKSVGTLLNIYRLICQQKKAVLYTVPNANLSVLHNIDEWKVFIAGCPKALTEKVQERIRQEEPRQADMPSLLQTVLSL